MTICIKRYIWLFFIMSIFCMMGCSKGMRSRRSNNSKGQKNTERSRVTEDFFEQYPENWENAKR